MHFKGWVRTSLIDFPGHIATVLFTGGCNFRCPMCHNAGLVLHPEAHPTLPTQEIWAFLAKRAGLVDGLVITGGEPTLQPDLEPFLQRVRGYSVDVKLDTNGYRPDVLKRLLNAKLVDYVAMDIKAPPDKYAHLSGIAQPDLARIEHSLRLIHESGLPYELRTTVVPELLDMDDIEALAHWLAALGLGNRAGQFQYVLQQFQGVNTLDPTLEHATPYAVDILEAMAERARGWLPNVGLRGI